jgi:hypothetical protein
MKKILSLIMLTALFFAPSASYAVNVTCYNSAAPGQIGCLTFLYYHEIQNSHNGTYGEFTWAGDRAPYMTMGWGIAGKPANTSTPVIHWHTGEPTVPGEGIWGYSVQVDGWDGQYHGSYDYEDWDTMDEDAAGTS